MNPNVEPATPAEAQWVASQRKWTQGWRRIVLPAAFGIYLIYVGQGVSHYSTGPGAIVGYAALVAFWLVYLATLLPAVQDNRRWLWTAYGALVALFVVELPFAHSAAFVMCLYLTVVSVLWLGGRAIPVVLAFAVGAALLPAAIPSWHDSLRSAFDQVTPIAIPVVALITFAVQRVWEGNQALTEARREIARLASENERVRIARDLHDLLGHSLTTITVKAGLAARLSATDPVRAAQEIAAVEGLARQSLADVRAAVASYREVTLSAELATGRELLRAAGIAADLPRAVDDIDPTRQELFGWVVREGLTNVVRHAHARCCAVRLSPTSIEIVDDGVGGAGRPGSGLSGLQERASELGGTVDAGPRQPNGWRLAVSMAPEGERV